MLSFIVRDRLRTNDILFNGNDDFMEFSCFRVLEDKRSHYEPSVPGAAEVDELLDDHDLYVPHFQRVSISGEDTSGVRFTSYFGRFLYTRC